MAVTNSSARSCRLQVCISGGSIEGLCVITDDTTGCGSWLKVRKYMAVTSSSASRCGLQCTGRAAEAAGGRDQQHHHHQQQQQQHALAAATALGCRFTKAVAVQLQAGDVSIQMTTQGVEPEGLGSALAERRDHCFCTFFHGNTSSDLTEQARAGRHEMNELCLWAFHLTDGWHWNVGVEGQGSVEGFRPLNAWQETVAGCQRDSRSSQYTAAGSNRQSRCRLVEW